MDHPDYSYVDVKFDRVNQRIQELENQVKVLSDKLKESTTHK